MVDRSGLYEALSALLGPRYAIRREIARGSTAAVYLADDRKHGRQVAIKVLHPDVARTVGAARFLTEIRIAASLSHPHILAVFDSGQAGGTLFYVMPFVDGETLRDRLDRETRLPLAAVVDLTTQIASALEHAHARGIVHRDLKPENILLAGDQAMVCDFGVARALAEAIGSGGTEPGLAVGTPLYMSPEQAVADPVIDARSDVYSLAVVVYEALGGTPPFAGEGPRAALTRKASTDPPSIRVINPDVPESVEAVVVRALARDPADRFPSAAGFAAALEQASLAASGPSPAGATGRGAKRRTVLATALLVAAAGLVAMIRPWQTAEPDLPPGWTLIAEVEGTAPDSMRETIGSVLAGLIDQSGRVARLPGSQVAQGIQAMLLPDTAPLTGDVARELAVRAGVRAIIVPVLDNVEGRYSLTLRVLDAAADTLIRALHSTASAGDELLGAVSAAADSATALLAGGRRSTYGRWPPLATPSLDAHQTFNAGFRYVNRNERRLAREAFADALRLDPGFAFAACMLGLVQSEDGLMEAADSSFALAFRQPGERLSEFHRLTCRVYHAAHRGDMDEVLRNTERIASQFNVDHSNVAVALALVGRHDEAVEYLEEVWQQYPFEPPDREVLNLGRWLMQAGQYERAKEVLAPLPVNDAQRQLLARLALHSGDWEAAEEMARTTISHLPVRVSVSTEVAAVRGRIRAMFDELRFATSVAGGSTISAADAYEIMLLLAIVSEDVALDPGDIVPATDTTAQIGMLRGLWALHHGDFPAARSALSATVDLTTRAPGSARERSDLCLRLVLEARLALSEHNLPRAIQLVGRSTCRLDDRGGRIFRLGEWTLADTYEKAGMADSAAARFADLANNRPAYRAFNTPRGYTHSFAHRRAAMLYRQLGDRTKALEHWRTFLRDFTEPDSAYVSMREQAETRCGRWRARSHAGCDRGGG